ncbi:MAG: hypothetical protein ACRCUS_01105, partial [Anaerovoracaceae bacterium]
TVGDLAKADVGQLRAMLKSHGQLIWDYANGRDNAPVTLNTEIQRKSVGNSITLPKDATDEQELKNVLLALSERVGMRLRKQGAKASLVSVNIRTSEFANFRHQRKLSSHIDSTSQIYDIGCQLLKHCWNGDPLRQIGISVGEFDDEDNVQISLFDVESASKVSKAEAKLSPAKETKAGNRDLKEDIEKEDRINSVVDEIRKEFGDRAIVRGVFVNTDTDAIQGGVNDGEYLMMGGYTL